MMDVLGLSIITMFVLSCGISFFWWNYMEKVRISNKEKPENFLPQKILLIGLILFTGISLTAIINYGSLQNKQVYREEILRDSVKILEERIDNILKSGKNDTLDLDGQQIIFKFYDEK